MERIWGGRRLESEFGKKLPAQKRIGESWEIVDRPEAQSVVVNGPLCGKTLHDLWIQDRSEIFGDLPDASRFPLLVKLLDAHEKLSLQVHPPEKVASKLGGEPKTEFWYVAAAEPCAELYLGFRDSITRDQFEKALGDGTAADHVHKIRVTTGDAAFLPAGRFHAVGAGILLIEVQQNSDTTYRVFDWNRVDEKAGSVSYKSIRRFNVSILMMFDRDCCIPTANCCCVTIYSRFRNGISIHRARSLHADSSQSRVASPARCAARMSILRVENFS